MESNKEEASRALGIARTHRDAGKLSSALKFARKSESLCPTSEAQSLIATLEKMIADAAASGPSGETAGVHSTSTTSNGNAARASAAETHPSAPGMHHRHTASSSAGASSSSGTQSASSSQKRDYTPDQLKVVKRVKACKVTEYYAILAVEKECDDAQIRKAYRKLALALHPDKNGAPGADEAFKNPDKRAVYDRNPGFDPESRGGGGAGPSGFSNMARGFGGGMGRRPGGFDGEVTPEDIFNMFFGGQMGGGGGFGGPVFTTSFGPGGFSSFGGGGAHPGMRARARAARQNGSQGAQQPPNWVQLLPLILLFGFALLTLLPNILGFGPTPDPDYVFTPRPAFDSMRNTANLEVPYYVNAEQFAKHPIWESIPQDKKNDPKAARYSPKLREFEQQVESRYVQRLRDQCEIDMQRKQQRIEANRGFFGIGADWDNIRRIEAEPITSCQKLRSLNGRRI